MTTITVLAPAHVAAPRAALPAASLFVAVLNWFQSGSGARAGRRAQAGRVTEAAAVREYARQYASHDPRFAADLFAAADRHERAE